MQASIVLFLFLLWKVWEVATELFVLILQVSTLSFLWCTRSRGPKCNWNWSISEEALQPHLFLYSSTQYGSSPWARIITATYILPRSYKSNKIGGDWGHYLLKRKRHILLFLCLIHCIWCNECYLDNAHLGIYTCQSYGSREHQIGLNMTSVRDKRGKYIIKQHTILLAWTILAWGLR